jgi:hypothetical protein
MGGADEAADDPLEMDLHRCLVNGGLQHLGGSVSKRAGGDPSIGSWVRPLVGLARIGPPFLRRRPLNLSSPTTTATGTARVSIGLSAAASGSSPMKPALPIRALMPRSGLRLHLIVGQGVGCQTITVSRRAADADIAGFG